MIHITEAHELRDAIFAKLLAPSHETENIAQHDVWPCVRKGAGEQWLRQRGETFKPSKSAALYFLRGHSAEALIMGAAQAAQTADQWGVAEDDKLTVLNGVGCHPDASRDDLYALAQDLLCDKETQAVGYQLGDWLDAHPDIAFGEIKSTNFSSYNLYKLTQRGGFGPDDKVPMRSYFDQMLNYAVATESRRAVLIVYTLHGDYADKRSKCPNCGNALGEWIDDFKRECSACGYASKKIDLWAYLVTFDEADIVNRKADVFIMRPAQYRRAIAATDEAGVLAAAPGSTNFYCRSCKVGERIGCEHAGKKYD